MSVDDTVQDLTFKDQAEIYNYLLRPEEATVYKFAMNLEKGNYIISSISLAYDKHAEIIRYN